MARRLLTREFLIRSRGLHSPTSGTSVAGSVSPVLCTTPVDTLVEAALRRVPELGWTDVCLDAAVLDAGLSPAARALLPRGVVDLVNQFVHRCNRTMSDAFLNRVSAPDKLSQRVAELVRYRLLLYEPVKSHWPHGLALQALPSNVFTAWDNHAVLIDEIWALAGDQSTEFSWYTRRAALLGVYHATELFWLNDTSPDARDSWNFLDRRLDHLFAMEESCSVRAQGLSDAIRATLETVGSLVTSTRSGY
mmetsp:Transcript_2537/g.4392  ORF Transcript_2537/g.4392 Transcript_2537/m.4392 type:complete len:249 (+) Transcript_2537:2065-2811(+)